MGLFECSGHDLLIARVLAFWLPWASGSGPRESLGPAATPPVETHDGFTVDLTLYASEPRSVIVRRRFQVIEFVTASAREASAAPRNSFGEGQRRHDPILTLKRVVELEDRSC